MRLHEFIAKTKEPLTNLSVPTSTREPAVADLQKVLVALGFPLPRFGIDGIRAEETNSAIKKFQQSAKIPVSGEPDQTTIAALNAMIKSNPSIVSNLTKTTQAELIKSRTLANVEQLPSNELMQQARSVAEQYLGRPIKNQEWNYLLRATADEASSNPTEQAYVMGVILNRTRSGRWGNDIISVLTAKNQFQAVTGTRHNPGPNAAFQNPDRRLNSIANSAISTLMSVPQNLFYFTAASTQAYGPGTNIKFRTTLLNKPNSVQIGGTIFAESSINRVPKINRTAVKSNTQVVESTSRETAISDVVSAVRSIEIEQIYPKLEELAENYAANNGHLRGYALIAGGMANRFFQRFFDDPNSGLRPLLQRDLMRHVPLAAKKLVQQTLGYSSRIDSLTKAELNIPQLLITIGNMIKSQELVDAAKYWIDAGARYRKRIQELKAELDDEDPVDQPKKSQPASQTHTQQRGQLEDLVNSILRELPKKVSGEIRQAIARDENKIVALQRELAKRNIKI